MHDQDMRADDVIEALDVLDRAGVRYWVGAQARVDTSVPEFTRPRPEYWYFRRARYLSSKQLESLPALQFL